MHVGYGSRAVSSPIASGQIGRFSVPTRFIPLSQFFLQGSEVEKGEKALYGRQERPKAKGSKDTRKPAAPQDASKAPQEEDVLDERRDTIAPAKREALEKGIWDKLGGRGTRATGILRVRLTDRLARVAGIGTKGKEINLKEVGDLMLIRLAQHMGVEGMRPATQEGITTTANVPTVPVPLGGKLDGPGWDKKKRRGKDLPARMTLLLRRLF
jgi:hypothetical protein